MILCHLVKKKTWNWWKIFHNLGFEHDFFLAQFLFFTDHYQSKNLVKTNIFCHIFLIWNASRNFCPRFSGKKWMTFELVLRGIFFPRKKQPIQRRTKRTVKDPSCTISHAGSMLRYTILIQSQIVLNLNALITDKHPPSTISHFF